MSFDPPTTENKLNTDSLPKRMSGIIDLPLGTKDFTDVSNTDILFSKLASYYLCGSAFCNKVYEKYKVEDDRYTKKVQVRDVTLIRTDDDWDYTDSDAYYKNKLVFSLSDYCDSRVNRRVLGVLDVATGKKCEAGQLKDINPEAHLLMSYMIGCMQEAERAILEERGQMVEKVRNEASAALEDFCSTIFMTHEENKAQKTKKLFFNKFFRK
jgi:hypothetical protein